MTAVLEVNNLNIDYVTKEGTLQAVRDINFKLEEGERLGLVGESGCGKTTLAKALMRLLPENGVVSNGEIIFKGNDLVPMTDEQIRQLRWKHISMISQSAMNALNPVYTVGDQIIEAIQTHDKVSKKDAYARAADVFNLVNLEEKRLKDYPHQMSGGMKQRAIIAMSLVHDPSLIIADEPTTALDVVVQDRILNQIIQVQKKMNSSMVFITHDISVVSETCTTIIVMYGGKMMEKANRRDFFKNPYHPYSLGLQNAFPSITDMGDELISIPGTPPKLINPEDGCRFKERCPFATNKCNETPEPVEVDKDHFVACHYTDKVTEFREKAAKSATWDQQQEKLIETS
ncbi:ABC transporter ATP-binding protein [Evansella halocellulosilytica]|uniref:ABC transporter ATP-binding protein n=1 Tax=Evansella halocellulosilytica TaxID=2011013 RepID=UPI000BB8A842|nr:ABC transporter ATP-binding protein [Evansella halocellulosilytica]